MHKDLWSAERTRSAGMRTSKSAFRETKVPLGRVNVSSKHFGVSLFSTTAAPPEEEIEHRWKLRWTLR